MIRHKVRSTIITAAIALTVGATSPAQAIPLTMTTDFEFNGSGGPADPTIGQFSITFDTGLDYVRKAVDAISFSSSGTPPFPTTSVFFDYRHSVFPAGPSGPENFQLDVYFDGGTSAETSTGGLAVVFGQNDFLIRTAGIPSQIPVALANGGTLSGSNDLLGAGFILYSKPGFSVAFNTSGATNTFASSVAVIDVPAPATLPVAILGFAALGLLARRRRA